MAGVYMEVNETQHVTTDLSAYLDQELAPAEQARVSAHLETCRACSARLAELRATASLIAALPAEARPSRSLVPATEAGWNWLRPVRSLSAFASGAFVMLFLITAVAQSGSDLGGGTTSWFTPLGPTGQAAAPAAATRGTEPGAATQAADPVPAAVQQERNVATQPPAAAPGMGAAGGTPLDTASGQTPGAFAATEATEDAAKRAAQDNERSATAQNYGIDGPPSPLIWLGAALLLAMVAGFAHWRLRAA